MGCAASISRSHIGPSPGEVVGSTSVVASAKVKLKPKIKPKAKAKAGHQLPNGGMSKRKLTMRHTCRLDTEAAQALQTLVLDMARTGRVELTSSPEQDEAGERLGTLTQAGLVSLRRVPGVVFSMPHLTELNLRGNEISSLPKEIADLTALQVLVVSKNQLTMLPEELSALGNLRVLELTSNQLSALPERLGDLVALQVLRVNRNHLTRLPDSIARCRRLRVLNVYNNALTELSSAVGALGELQDLNVSNNALTALPDDVSRWKNLRRLLLQVNRLRSLPPLDALCNLEVLQVQQNELETLPSMHNLVHLVKLDASTNHLRELPEASLAHMTALMYLNLRRNHLPAIPPLLASCRHLEILDLGGNPIASPVPVELAALSDLRTLLLDNCDVTVLPIELIRLSHMCRAHLGARLYMDDPETCEVVLGLRDSCARNGGWLKTGEWGDRRTDSILASTGRIGSDALDELLYLYDDLDSQMPDEPHRLSRIQGGEGSSDILQGGQSR